MDDLEREGSEPSGDAHFVIAISASGFALLLPDVMLISIFTLFVIALFCLVQGIRIGMER